MPPKKQEGQHKSLDHLEKRIGYKFSEHVMLERALTHTSVNNKRGSLNHYERLEFLGDRVLGLCISTLLFEKFRNADEGELSLRFNALVRGSMLVEISDEIKLHEFIRTGDDLKTITSKRMQSIRADVMESLIASIYLDGGLEATKTFIERFWAERLEDSKNARRDSKTALQEWAHSRSLDTPRYAQKERTGPDHDPEFTVCVKVKGKISCEGKGSSKRIAEQAAAKEMLMREGVWKEDIDEETDI